MTTLDTPAGPLTLADSIHEVTALAYTRFNQAWLRQTGLATDGHGIQDHLARHAAFLGAGELEAAGVSFNNLIEALNAQDAGEPFLAAVLAPLLRTVAGTPWPADGTPDGLARAADAIMATGISQGALVQATEDVKKKFSAN